MDQHMLERLASDGHLQLAQPRAIRLEHFTRPMHLLQYGHLALVQGSPLGDPSLQRTQLAFLVPAWPLFTQPLEEGFRFEFRGGVQHLFQFGPMLSKRIGARAVAAWLLEFAWQVASLL